MLELKNVTKCFGNFKALDDLSMTVPKGAVYGHGQIVQRFEIAESLCHF